MADAAGLAAELGALVDVLIPGDDMFPAASTVGAQAKLIERLDRLMRDGAHLRLLQALAEAGGPLRALAADRRADVVRRVETGEPALFAAALRAACLSYYENPAVHAVIRSLGHPYNTRLLPDGYDVPPFDPAVDAPTHGRGRCIATGDVRRVDLSGLDVLSERNDGR